MYFKKRKRKQIRFELIPMIDVMMIISLFLAILAFLPQFEGALDTQLPQAGSNEKPPVAITITIDKGGNIYLEDRSYTHSQFLERIKTILIKSPTVPIIVAADKRLTYEQVISVLDSLKSAGAKRIALATESRGIN